MSAPLAPQGRRARILAAAAREPRTLSDICRRVTPKVALTRQDKSLTRLKVTSALRTLKADGLIVRTPAGWRATPAGRQAVGID
jgi:DNA-binding HxlR family transcriptional regulator